MSREQIPYAQFRKRDEAPMPAWGKDQAGEYWVRCKCGVVMGLCHTIAANGDVTPSLFHDVPECGFHVMGTLLDWEKHK